jgi:hypothetical protein
VTRRTDWRGYRVNRNRPLQSCRRNAVLGETSGRAAIVVPVSSAIENIACTKDRESFVRFAACVFITAEERTVNDVILTEKR